MMDILNAKGVENVLFLIMFVMVLKIVKMVVMKKTVVSCYGLHIIHNMRISLLPQLEFNNIHLFKVVTCIYSHLYVTTLCFLILAFANKFKKAYLHLLISTTVCKINYIYNCYH